MALIHECLHRAFIHPFIAFIVSSVLFISSSSAISLYKWIDADGKISYQDRPPPSGQVFEEKTFTDRAPVSATAALNGNQLPVSLYISNDCASCGLVRTILEMNKVPYKQYLIDFNQEFRQALLTVSGSYNVPTVVIGDQVIDKLDRRNLESALRLGGHPRPTPIVE